MSVYGELLCTSRRTFAHTRWWFLFGFGVLDFLGRSVISYSPLGFGFYFYVAINYTALNAKTSTAFLLSDVSTRCSYSTLTSSGAGPFGFDGSVPLLLRSEKMGPDRVGGSMMPPDRWKGKLKERSTMTKSIILSAGRAHWPYAARRTWPFPITGIYKCNEWQI